MRFPAAWACTQEHFLWHEQSNMTTKTLTIDGIHCASCAMLIEGELEDIGAAANCSWVARTVEVSYDPAKLTDKDIHAAIGRAGYRVSSK